MEGIAAAGRMLVISSARRGVSLLDLRTREVQWEKAPERGAPTAPIVTNKGTVIYGETQGSLLALSLSDGREIARAEGGSGFCHPVRQGQLRRRHLQRRPLPLPPPQLTPCTDTNPVTVAVADTVADADADTDTDTGASATSKRARCSPTSTRTWRFRAYQAMAYSCRWARMKKAVRCTTCRPAPGYSESASKSRGTLSGNSEVTRGESGRRGQRAERRQMWRWQAILRQRKMRGPTRGRPQWRAFRSIGSMQKEQHAGRLLLVDDDSVTGARQAVPP